MVTVKKIFKTIQTTNKPVLIPNYDFSKAVKYKLILFIYLVINPSNMNNSLHSSKMRIFVHLKHFLGTLYKTYIINLMLIIKEDSFYIFTHYEDSVNYSSIY